MYYQCFLFASLLVYIHRDILRVRCVHTMKRYKCKRANVSICMKIRVESVLRESEIHVYSCYCAWRWSFSDNLFKPSDVIESRADCGAEKRRRERDGDSKVHFQDCGVQAADRILVVPINPCLSCFVVQQEWAERWVLLSESVERQLLQLAELFSEEHSRNDLTPFPVMHFLCSLYFVAFLVHSSEEKGGSLKVQRDKTKKKWKKVYFLLGYKWRTVKYDHLYRKNSHLGPDKKCITFKKGREERVMWKEQKEKKRKFKIFYQK